MTDLPQYAFRVSARELPENDHAVPLHRGDVVTSFRGEDYTFEGVTRPAYGNSSGRVVVSRPCPEAYDTDGGRTCPHMWHRDGIERREYFPAVFDLYLGTLTGDPA